MTEIGDEPELVGDDSISQLVAEVEERIRASERETDAVRVRAGYWRAKYRESQETSGKQFRRGFEAGVFFGIMGFLTVFLVWLWLW